MIAGAGFWRPDGNGGGSGTVPEFSVSMQPQSITTVGGNTVFEAAQLQLPFNEIIPLGSLANVLGFNVNVLLDRGTNWGDIAVNTTTFTTDGAVFNATAPALTIPATENAVLVPISVDESVAMVGGTYTFSINVVGLTGSITRAFTVTMS